MARASRPLDELDEKELQQRVAAAEKTIAEIDRLDTAEVVRSGKAEETLARMDQAFDEIDAARGSAHHAPGAEGTGRHLEDTAPVRRQLRDTEERKKAVRKRFEPVMRAFLYASPR